MKKILRPLLLLALLLCAFLLYSVMKTKGSPSLLFPPADATRNTALYRHVEELTVNIGSRSVYEYDKLTAAKEYILATLRAMGCKPYCRIIPTRGKRSAISSRRCRVKPSPKRSSSSAPITTPWPERRGRTTTQARWPCCWRCATA